MGAQTQGIEETLTGYGHLALDTMCFIYHFEANPEYLPFTHTLFALIEKGEIKASTSTLTLAEVLVKPFEQGNRAAVEDYRYALTNFPNLDLREVSAEIAVEAALYKARYGIGLPDAIQVATGVAQGCQAFITNDLILKRIQDTEVLVIGEILEIS